MKLLTFEFAPDKKEFEIHMNEKGYDDFLLYLEKLKKAAIKSKSNHEHDHLMTPEWAGQELTSSKQGISNELINQVTIRYWKDR